MIFKRNLNRKSRDDIVSSISNGQSSNPMEHDHLIITYNQMITDMECILLQPRASHLTLQKALAASQKKAVESGIVNREEAHEIAAYIKMDVNDVADSMMESGAECYDWLLLDIEMIEFKVLERYLSAAKLTRDIMEQFKIRH